MSSRIVFQPSLKLRLTGLVPGQGLLPEALVGKRPAGSCFQILFEGSCAPIVVKTNNGNKAPWQVSGGMRRTALIMGGQSLLEIYCRTDIALSGMGETLDKVNVSHLFLARFGGLLGTPDCLMKQEGIEPKKRGRRLHHKGWPSFVRLR